MTGVSERLGALILAGITSSIVVMLGYSRRIRAIQKRFHTRVTAANMLISRIHSRRGRELPLRAAFAAPTVIPLATLLDNARKARGPSRPALRVR